MENNTTFLEPLFERVEVYGKTSYELYKLKAVERTSDILSTLVSRGVSMLTLCFFLTFLSIGASFWLGDILGELYYGFFCVAGFYIVVWVLLHFFFHKSIKKSIANSIVSQILN